MRLKASSQLIRSSSETKKNQNQKKQKKQNQKKTKKNKTKKNIISTLFQNLRNIHKWESSEIMFLLGSFCFFWLCFFRFFLVLFFFGFGLSSLIAVCKRNKTAKTQRTVFGHKKTPKRVGTWGGGGPTIYIYICINYKYMVACCPVASSSSSQ